MTSTEDTERKSPDDQPSFEEFFEEAFDLFNVYLGMDDLSIVPWPAQFLAHTRAAVACLAVGGFRRTPENESRILGILRAEVGSLFRGDEDAQFWQDDAESAAYSLWADTVPAAAADLALSASSDSDRPKFSVSCVISANDGDNLRRQIGELGSVLNDRLCFWGIGAGARTEAIVYEDGPNTVFDFLMHVPAAEWSDEKGIFDGLASSLKHAVDQILKLRGLGSDCSYETSVRNENGHVAVHLRAFVKTILLPIYLGSTVPGPGWDL